MVVACEDEEGGEQAAAGPHTHTLPCPHLPAPAPVPVVLHALACLPDTPPLALLAWLVVFSTARRPCSHCLPAEDMDVPLVSIKFR